MNRRRKLSVAVLMVYWNVKWRIFPPLSDYFFSGRNLKSAIFRHLFVYFQISVYTLGEFHKNRNNSKTAFATVKFTIDTPTLQIQYCYSLNDSLEYFYFSGPPKNTGNSSKYMYIRSGGATKLKMKNRQKIAKIR